MLGRSGSANRSSASTLPGSAMEDSMFRPRSAKAGPALARVPALLPALGGAGSAPSTGLDDGGLSQMGDLRGGPAPDLAQVSFKPVTIDFDDLRGGAIVTGQYAQWA